MISSDDVARSFKLRHSKITDKIVSEAYDKVKNVKCIYCDNESVLEFIRVPDKNKYLTYGKQVCLNCWRPTHFPKGGSITFLKDLTLVRFDIELLGDE